MTSILGIKREGNSRRETVFRMNSLLVKQFIVTQSLIAVLQRSTIDLINKALVDLINVYIKNLRITFYCTIEA